MNQMLAIGQTALTTSNIEYNAYLKSNYANYQSSTSTKSGNAFIDVLDGALLWIGELPRLSETDEIEQKLVEV